jgi:hypothetical protein
MPDTEDPNLKVSKTGPASDSAVAERSDVCKVGVRVPPFWPEEPELWFTQMEGQFMISGITADATKFYYVISQLEHQYIFEVKDVINSPPAQNKYDKLKTELISRLSASQEKKHRELLMHEELGDRKPSQYWRRLKTLAGGYVSDEFLKTVWSSRLPPNLQTVIASQPTLSVEMLADLADKVSDIAPTATQVFAVGEHTKDRSNKPSGSGSSDLVHDLAFQMSELRKEVASLRAQFDSQPHGSHNRSRFRSQNRDRSHSGNRRRSSSRPRNDSYCFYHNRFGSKANRCMSPCTYASENSSGSRK